MRLTVIILPLLAILLGGCPNTFDRLNDVGRPPHMEEVVQPQDRSDYTPVPWQEDENAELASLSRSTNSLWQPGARTFFRDQRTRRVGDIIKVVINISDQANLNNETQTTRQSADTAASPALYGLESLYKNFIPGGRANPASLLNISGNNSYQGQGTITRKEDINTQIATMISQILPNGNLVIRGSQAVRINYEAREITVSGIVRPEDISVDNGVSLEQIAEARISYGGRGQMSDIQAPRLGSQLVDILSPF